MKVRKRNKGNGYGAAYCPFEGPTQTAFEHARWKRKNRIAQLKRTIARLEREKEEAYHRGHKAGYDLGFSRYWF